ncbi:Oidioi.mRNA.OKI2018_I69.chr2.g4094.t1.cds [Oikopleura dioica]|uniref:Oidioi.mRNA.OKI2018_I69.chr2.g4094.t1.cds n=1 Tax=Oikopleura dioica TaxID=34765 RepID=A0ABN7SVW0_OIKDI|nr:Oidioi.mRNA.OKI2018_I69.chr2.g4094.t1.cds [Oikopleura dioica]
MGCGASKEVVEEEIQEERRREKRRRERKEKKAEKKKKKKSKKSKKKKKKKSKEQPQSTTINVTVPKEEKKEEPKKEKTPPPPKTAEPVTVIVQQPPAPVQQEPPPPAPQPESVQQQPQPQAPLPSPPVQAHPQQEYYQMPSTMGVSLEDLSDKISLIEQNIQLQSQTNEQIHKIIIAIAANQNRQALPPPPQQPPIQMIQPPPQQPQVVQVPVPVQVPVHVPVTPAAPVYPDFDNIAGFQPSQTDNMTSAVLQQHLTKLKNEQNMLIRDLNRIKRHGHYDPNSFKVKSILSYIQNQQKAIEQLESAVNASNFAETDFADFSFPTYSQPARPQSMNYKPTSSAQWNANAAMAPVGTTGGQGGWMYPQQAQPNYQRMEVKTPQVNPHNTSFPGY